MKSKLNIILCVLVVAAGSFLAYNIVEVNKLNESNALETTRSEQSVLIDATADSLGNRVYPSLLTYAIKDKYETLEKAAVGNIETGGSFCYTYEVVSTDFETDGSVYGSDSDNFTVKRNYSDSANGERSIHEVVTDGKISSKGTKYYFDGTASELYDNDINGVGNLVASSSSINSITLKSNVVVGNDDEFREDAIKITDSYIIISTSDVEYYFSIGKDAVFVSQDNNLSLDTYMPTYSLCKTSGDMITEDPR